VLKPPASIETRAIFASPLLARSGEAAILESFAANAGQGLFEPASFDPVTAGWGRNDLQAAAEAECAQVVQATAVLHQQFGNSRMTGSGSAVFARAGTGVAPSAAMPVNPAKGWVGRMCRSLDAHPLVGWAAD
jgi:4-diphosphocytidyl-2-C-methyl-D-erythritol kinase